MVLLEVEDVASYVEVVEACPYEEGEAAVAAAGVVAGTSSQQLVLLDCSCSLNSFPAQHDPRAVLCLLTHSRSCCVQLKKRSLGPGIRRSLRVP